MAWPVLLLLLLLLLKMHRKEVSEGPAVFWLLCMAAGRDVDELDWFL